MKSTIRYSTLAILAGVIATSFVQAQDQTTHFTNADGAQVTVHSGSPSPVSYGPKPDFAQLDTNHDGYISASEAEAYVPLLNDFDNLAHKSGRISKRQYEQWDHR